MNKLIFLSSPYSHPDKRVVELRCLETTKYVAEQVSIGNTMFSPIIYGHELLKHKDMPSDWEFWKNFCVSFMSRCSEVWVLQLDGWEESNGVKSEIEIAKELNIPVKYVKY